MEETIGYEALLSTQEWDSLDVAEWTDDFVPDGSSSPSGVTLNGSGSAALGQEVASEGSSFEGPSHTVSIRPRELQDGTTEHVLECEVCQEIGTADTYDEAQSIIRLHESFTAELIAKWEV